MNKIFFHNLYKTLFITIVVLVFSQLMISQVFADSVTTSVTVGNTPPAFTVAPAEDPESTGAAPTNVGANVTFDATATDSNSENYYLAICRTNSVTPTNGGAPTCGGTSWCISSSTTSGNQATCNYTVQVGDVNETYDWYAFVCDGNASDAECSSSQQGAGNSGSPFHVNHPPIFNAISNNTPQNPGSNVTWSTDVSTLDTDTNTVADTVRLVVCATAGITNGTCDGVQRCASSLVANNPTCSYLIPTPTADTSYAAYVYVVDNHNLAATGANNGSNSSYVVNNIAPVVTNVVINGGNEVNLTEGTTTSISITGDVTDNNGCGGGELTSVTSNLYRSGLGSASCDISGENDYDDCYAVITCTESSCTGAGASYSCSVSPQYHADPTDINTEFPLQNWLSTMIATDNNTASHSLESIAGVEFNSLTALNVTATIDYGTLGVGVNSGNLDQTTTTTATGNVGLDQLLSGTDMDDGGINDIVVAQQKYGLTAVSYSTATALSTTPTEIEINVPKTRSVGTVTTPEEDDTYWGIEIPGGTVAGVYSGTNTVTAVKGEVVNW